MKTLIAAVLTGLLILPATGAFAEEAPASVKNLAPTLADWGKTPALVAAVKEQNAKNMSLDTIKGMDKTWMATSGIDDTMKALMGNPAAKELLKYESSKPYFTEVFLMDNQGANVAMTNKTSDYWQGDEAKFKDSFAGGSGAIHIGKVKFDKSAQAYLVQVSVPVVDGGQVIGALTIGVNIDELEK